MQGENEINKVNNLSEKDRRKMIEYLFSKVEKNEININEIFNHYNIDINEIDKNKSSDSLNEIIDDTTIAIRGFRETRKISDEYKNREIFSSSNFDLCSKEEQEKFLTRIEQLSSLVTYSIKVKTGELWSLRQVVELIKYDFNYQFILKANRKVIFSSISEERPIGDRGYVTWNGLQIIDLDIKNEDIAKNLKVDIFNILSKEPWFLGVVLSSSKKSLHVYTKIRPISKTLNERKIEYICNFRHKYSWLYTVLESKTKKYGYTSEDIVKYMDLAMCKPQQGIFISSDQDMLLSTNFYDMRMDISFDGAFTNGIGSVIRETTRPELAQVFNKLEWFAKDATENPKTIVEKDDIIDKGDPENANGKGPKHYVHAQRWQLANTLNYLYGYDKGLDYLIKICSGTEVSELRGIMKTASIHEKPISTWAIDELNNRHGFNIKLKDETQEKLDDEFLDNIVNASNVIQTDIYKEASNEVDINDPISELLQEKNLYHKIEFHIKHNQYLSDIQDEILDNLDDITLLEAGAGYGKTEMVKRFPGRVMLVVPYTSIIESKIIADKEITDNWLKFSKTKSPKMEDMFGDKNAVITIDKFSRLNTHQLAMSTFDHIVIDESHLMFISSYRDVMNNALHMIANIAAKKHVIMMTGTPTGELLFIPQIKHIKVIKEDFRTKEVNIKLSNDPISKLIDICHDIAYDIVYNKKKILFPSNKGNKHYDVITSMIQDIIIKEFKENKKVNKFYYKKSNMGKKSMTDINEYQTFGENDIIFCSNYLSVGVDICDKFKFAVYFDELFRPQDIEQFANRIRNNDLYINLILETHTNDGSYINYNRVNGLVLEKSREDLLAARDIVVTLNDVIERNNEEAKYNPIMESFTAVNKFIAYDEYTNRYYIDETSLKLNTFENNYTDYITQLPILIRSMKYYGYTVNITKSPSVISEDEKEDFKAYARECNNARYDYTTVETMMFIEHLNESNFEIYKLLMKGESDIFILPEYADYRKDNDIYNKDLEIIAKNFDIINTLHSYYDFKTIEDIYIYCTEKKNNKIKFSELKRIVKFIKLDRNIHIHKLDFPIYKFIVNVHSWCNGGIDANDKDAKMMVAKFVANYMNSIKDLVVEDATIFELMYQQIYKLFTVITNKTKAKEKGKHHYTPYRLLWKKKSWNNASKNIYDNVKETEEFFIDTLLDNIKDDENKNVVINNNSIKEEYDIDNINIHEHLDDFERKDKMTTSEVIKNNELGKIFNESYNYDVYANSEGKLNERYIRKQKAQWDVLSNMMKNKGENINEDINNSLQNDLFSSILTDEEENISPVKTNETNTSGANYESKKSKIFESIKEYEDDFGVKMDEEILNDIIS